MANGDKVAVACIRPLVSFQELYLSCNIHAFILYQISLDVDQLAEHIQLCVGHIHTS